MNKMLLTTAIGALMLLGACDGASNKATTERLDALTESGTDPEKLVKLMEKFDGVIDRDNSIAEINDKFGSDLIEDPSNADISGILQTALNRNSDIGRAAQGINAADTQRLNAIFGYLPQLTAGYNMTQMDQKVIESDNDVFQEGNAKYPVTAITVQLRQPIVDVERLFNIKAASAFRTRSEVEYLAVVQETIYRTLLTYVDVVQSQNRVRSLRKRVALIRNQMDSESNLAQAGLADERTKRSLNAEKLRLTADMASAQSEYAAGLSKLSAISGASVKGVRAIALPSSVKGTEKRLTAEEAQSRAVEHNPSLIALAVGVVEEDLRRKQAIAADFSPVIEAIVGLEKEDRAASRFGGGSVTQDMSVGVQLTIPIFNKNGTGYRTLTSNVDLRNSVINYHAVKRQLGTDIDSALIELGQISSVLRSLRQAISEVNKNIASERALVKSGESAPIQVALHRASKIRLESDRSYQQMQYLKAWLRLNYLMGELSTEVLK